jgi:hypothetical protein
MTSPTQTPTSIPRLLLISAALLFCANDAVAGDDAQLHSRALLSGASGMSSDAVGTRSISRTEATQGSAPDAQESMRKTLLGIPYYPRTTRATTTAKSAISKSDSVAYVDATESARRMIAGIGG